MTDPKDIHGAESVKEGSTVPVRTLTSFRPFFIFKTMRNRTFESQCPRCDGYGGYEIMSGCNKPISDCCGGCMETVICPACQGDGKISKRVFDIIYRQTKGNPAEFENPHQTNEQGRQWLFDQPDWDFKNLDVFEDSGDICDCFIFGTNQERAAK